MRFNSKEDRHREGIKAPSDGLGHSSQHYRDTDHGQRCDGPITKYTNMYIHLMHKNASINVDKIFG